MSTDRKRLTSAIQRIAREDPEIRALLDDYRNSGGKPSESATSGSGAEDRQTCCDGSVSGNANPGSATRDPDAEDAGQEGGLNDDDPANLDMGQGTLSGVTDCATVEPVCFHGGGFIPPEGWDGPNDPPLDPTYEEGVYYIGTVANSPRTWPSLGVARSEVCAAYCDCASFQSQCDNCWDAASFSGSCSVDGQTPTFQFGSVSCDDDHDPICDEPPPLATSWPPDDCINLAIKNGSIVGSKYDPENDGSYSKPRSEMQLCDASGNQISIRPAGTGVLSTGEQTSVPERITGGWKTFNSTTSNGYLYDSSGTQIAHIDGNEYSDPNV